MLVCGEMLQCFCEVGNAQDTYAEKVMKAGTIVEHLPKKIGSACSLFIRKCGVIQCEVTDSHKRYLRDLVQGSLEIPCTLMQQAPKEQTDKAVNLNVLSMNDTNAI